MATPLIKKFPPDTRRFVKRNYVVNDNLRVAGEELKLSAASHHRCAFDVMIPAVYEIISPTRNVSGILDGGAYNGARFLAAGPHYFEPTSTSHHFMVLWAQAVAHRHFTPFEHHTSPNG